MPRSARKPQQQSRQDRPGVVEQSTPVVSMPTPAAEAYAKKHAAEKQRFLGRLHRFMGGEYREWHEIKLMRIGACIEIIDTGDGYLTPFEDFVENLLMLYVSGGERTTPEEIEKGDFAEFREHFQDALKIARLMNKRHADLLNPPEQPAEA